MSKGLTSEERLAMSNYRKKYCGQLGGHTVDEFLEALMELDYQSPEHDQFISQHENYHMACEEYRAIIEPAVQRAFTILNKKKNG